MFEVGWWESLISSIKQTLRRMGKDRNCLQGDVESVTGPCLPPIKIYIVHIQEHTGGGLSMRGFVGLISGGDAIRQLGPAN